MNGSALLGGGRISGSGFLPVLPLACLSLREWRRRKRMGWAGALALGGVFHAILLSFYSHSSEHLLLPVDRAMAVAGLGVRVLICGAISQRMEQRLKGLGIKVIADVCGPAEDVLRAYLRGSLDDTRFVMPGSIRSQAARGGAADGAARQRVRRRQANSLK